MAISDTEKFQVLVKKFGYLFVSPFFFARILKMRGDCDSHGSLSDDDVSEHCIKLCGNLDKNSKNYKALMCHVTHLVLPNIEKDAQEILQARKLRIEQALNVYWLKRNTTFIATFRDDLIKTVDAWKNGSDDDAYLEVLKEKIDNALGIVHGRNGGIDALFNINDQEKKAIEQNLKDKIRAEVDKCLPTGCCDALIDALSDSIYGIGKSTVYNWIDDSKKSNISKPQLKNEIDEAFDLYSGSLWEAVYKTKEACENDLITHMRLSLPIVSLFDESTRSISAKEEKDIEKVLENPQMPLPGDLLRKSSRYLFELAKVLKNQNRIHEAFYVVESLLRRAEEDGERYALKHYNQLMHFKAVLLSTDAMRRFEEAANIYRKLYYAHRYHIYEPEVVTLYASNLKRMALYDKATNYETLRKAPDTLLLKQALRLYRDSMALRAPHTRYQDSINIAYLCRILEAYEEKVCDKSEIRSFYDAFTKRRFSHNRALHEEQGERWWLYTTKAEFEALLGECGGKDCEAACFENVESWEALSRNYDEVGGFGTMEKTLQAFLSANGNKSPEPFEREATLRQVRLYLHFVREQDDAYKCMRALKAALEVLE